MQYVTIDGEAVTSRGELYALFAEALELPDWFGQNLDALYDCLGDVADEVVIDLAHRDALADALGEDYCERFLSLLLRLADENPNITLEF